MINLFVNISAGERNLDIGRKCTDLRPYVAAL